MNYCTKEIKCSAAGKNFKYFCKRKIEILCLFIVSLILISKKIVAIVKFYASSFLYRLVRPPVVPLFFGRSKRSFNLLQVIFKINYKFYFWEWNIYYGNWKINNLRLQSLWSKSQNPISLHFRLFKLITLVQNSWRLVILGPFIILREKSKVLKLKIYWVQFLPKPKAIKKDKSYKGLYYDLSTTVLYKIISFLLSFLCIMVFCSTKFIRLLCQQI